MIILDKPITTNHMKQTVENKRCTTCGEVKELKFFYRRVDSPDGYRNTCKSCSHWNKKRNDVLDTLENKECHQCKTKKPFTSFVADSRRTLGIGTICRSCAESKICRKCQIKKHVSEFPSSDRSKDGYRYSCKVCENKRVRLKYQSNHDFRFRKITSASKYRNKKDTREGRRERLLWNTYGITIQQYEELLSKQENKCAICLDKFGRRGREVLVVDHDHSTDSVRGLLCDPCNRALGMFRDDQQVLFNALRYLKRSHFG